MEERKMCESSHYYDEDVQVQTLYGVLHEAMLAGKTYAEVVSAAQTWVRHHKRHYIRTCVEEKDGSLYVVVHTCADFSEMFRKDLAAATNVLVPQPFQAIAQARLQQQLQ
jgi:hypothetical protein